MDNAENNRMCIEKLGELLAEREFEIVFNPDQCWVMCHLHLINLCTKHTCEGFTNVNASEIERNITTDTVKRHSNTEKYTPVNECVSKEDYIQAIHSKPLDKACSLVCAIHASGLRCDTFWERIKVGNEQGWYKYPLEMKVPLVKLLHEVVTRWDTLLFLLNRLRILRPAVDYFVCMPEWQEELGHLKLLPTEWLVLSDFECILMV
ncbi:hypothetical protein SCLCIDRAFT_49656, partial [Scleroderma citrinum Foug A]